MALKITSGNGISDNLLSMFHCSHIKLWVIILSISWHDNAHKVLGTRDLECNTSYHCLYYIIGGGERGEVILPVSKALNFSGHKFLSTFTLIPFSSINKSFGDILLYPFSPLVLYTDEIQAM